MVPFFISNIFYRLRIQMIGVVRVLARIAPADVHLTCGQVNHQGVDGFLTVERIRPFDGMIADRIREVDMILLNDLQSIDGMRLALAQQAIGTEISNPRRDQFLRAAFDFLHTLRKIMVGMHEISVRAVKNIKALRRDFNGIHFAAFMDKHVVIACGTVRNGACVRYALEMRREANTHRVQPQQKKMPLRESDGYTESIKWAMPKAV